MNPKPGAARAIELDIDCARYPEIDRALAYWRAKKGERAMPSRADIDPLEISKALPRVMMAEVSHDPLEFCYRLAGTGLFPMHGEELTGKRARDLEPPEFGALIHEHYCEAVERRTPLLHLIELRTDEVTTSYARIILPLSSDGAVIDRLMTVESHEDHGDALQKFFEETKG